MIDKEKEISKVTIDNTSVPLYEKPTQTKTIIPTTQEQVVNADDGYNLSSVTVEAVTSDIDGNIQPTNIRQGVTILGVNGNLAPDKPDQSKSVNPTTSQQIIVADTGYELAQVTVNAVTNDIDSNIIPENIKEGVSILGVEGNLKSGGGENKLPQVVDGSITTLTAEDLEGATNIRQYAFYYSSLTSITIPDSVTSIGNYAFSNCSSLTSITIPDSVTRIGEMAFINCTGLASIGLPSSLTRIYTNAFYEDRAITNVYYDGNINDWINIDFSNNASNPNFYGKYFYINGDTTNPITELNIDTLTEIPKYSFLGSWLKNLTLGNQVTSIGNYAFNNSDLTTLTIPENVTSIGDYAFSDCLYLTEFNFNATSMDDLSLNNNVFANIGRNSNGVTVNIGANVTKIPAYLFWSNPSSLGGTLANIVIVNFAENTSCTSIGNYAFYNCINLTNITIPTSVTSIGTYAFSGCSSLSTISIPSGVTSIEVNTFANCSSLTTLTIPENVTSIGNYAFDGCTTLTEINLNATNMNDLSSNSNVFRYAGQDGAGITVNIGANVTRIPAYLFNVSSSFYAPKIVTAIFAEGSLCTSIGNYAFNYCANLTSITIPNSISSIGRAAFRGCTSLTNVIFQGQVPNIQTETFRNCNSITKYDFRNCTTVPTLYNTNSLGHASGCQIIVPDTLYDTWTTSSVWSSLTNVTFVKASEYVE